MVPGPRWTHVALPVNDVDASAAWYARFTPLEVIDRRTDELGSAIWLAEPTSRDHPFVLVLVAVNAEAGTVGATLRPFAHLGFELPSAAAVTEMARVGAAAGCLEWEPQLLPPPVGYVCALSDPDGNLVEFSFDQGVYAKVMERWGPGETGPA